MPKLYYDAKNNSYFLQLPAKLINGMGWAPGDKIKFTRCGLFVALGVDTSRSISNNTLSYAKNTNRFRITVPLVLVTFLDMQRDQWFKLMYESSGTLVFDVTSEAYNKAADKTATQEVINKLQLTACSVRN
jgi:hypothetical protein